MLSSPSPLSQNEFDATTEFFLSHLKVGNKLSLEEFLQSLKAHDGYNQILNSAEDLKKLIEILFVLTLNIDKDLNEKFNNEAHAQDQLPNQFIYNFINVLNILNHVLKELDSRIDNENTFPSPHAVLIKLSILNNLIKAISYCNLFDNTKALELGDADYPISLDVKKGFLQEAYATYNHCAPYINGILFENKGSHNEIENAFKSRAPQFLLLKYQIDYELCLLSYQQCHYNSFNDNVRQFSATKILLQNHIAANITLLPEKFLKTVNITTERYTKNIDTLKEKFEQRELGLVDIISRMKISLDKVELTSGLNQASTSPVKELTTVSLQQVSLTTPNHYFALIETYKKDPIKIFRALHNYQDWSFEKKQAIVNSVHTISNINFNDFLNEIASLFINPNAVSHYYACYNLGLIPHIALGLGTDWMMHFQRNSIVFDFIKTRLNQPTLNGKSNHAIYFIALFLVANIEKQIILLSHEPTTYSLTNLVSQVVNNVIAQFFSLYQGKIEDNMKKNSATQLKHNLLTDLWPNFIKFKIGYKKIDSFTPLYNQQVNANKPAVGNKQSVGKLKKKKM